MSPEPTQKRTIFSYGYAATGARVRKGIPNGVLQHAAIFPEGNHARLPLEADLKAPAARHLGTRNSVVYRTPPAPDG